MSALTSFGQGEKPIKPPGGDLPVRRETIPKDSLLAKAKRDTILTKQDSLEAKQDSIRRRSDIETTINYSARDSINSSIDRKIVHLYGDAKIKYGIIQLIAEDITIDYETSTISAAGRLDSLGRRVGYPIFINGGEKYETKSIVYNFKTKKALISEVVTTQGDAFLHGEAVFKNQKNDLLSLRNAYTTCNLVHPHYQIIASRAKAIPGDKVVVGPFHMEINDVPLPLGFAFGIFPSPRKAASGIIIPAYGEENLRGFFLRNGGYFFDINDYFKLQVTGDLYSKGSSAFYINSNYRKRYHHSGTFNFSFTSNRLTSNVEETSSTNDFRIAWSHTPQSKGTGRFSASVNAATSTYNNNNFLPLSTNTSSPRIDNTSRKASSNISYSKSFGSVLNVGINYRINQDLVTKQVDMPLPDLSLNVNNIYPFKRSSDKLILQNLSLRYTMTATNQITNNLGQNFRDRSGNVLTHDSIAPFNLQTLPALIRNAKKGIHHVLPLATSFKLLNFFTVSPSINFDELWYFEKLNWGVSDDGKTAVVKDTIRDFNRVNNYSLNVSMTTRIYGTYFFKNNKGKPGVQAIRHIINPSIGFSYSPDFSDPSYGYYQPLVLKDNPNIVYKSVHEGFVYGSSRAGKSSSMSFGVNNNVEMKVLGKGDSTTKKVALFNTLSVSSAYNFAADSFRLAPYALAANTNVLNDKLNVNITGSIDPYKYVTLRRDAPYVTPENPTGVVADKVVRSSALMWETYYPTTLGYHVANVSRGIGRLTNANLALSTNLSPKGQKKDTDTRSQIGKSNASDADKAYLLNNPDSYIDFKIPWNLRLSYNVDYSYTVLQTKPAITQTVRFNGDFSLSEKWKIVYNSGFDFQQKDFTTTQLTISRDLHCWLINLNWVPFGKYTSYTFYIGIKSSLLKDLKLNRTRSFYDQ